MYLQDLSRHDFIGSCEFLLSDAIRAQNQIWKSGLFHPRRPKNGTITLRIEQLSKNLSNDLAKLTLDCDMYNPTTIFYRLMRAKEGSGEFIPVYQSEGSTFSGKLAKWRQARLAAASLMRDNVNYPLSLQLYEYRGGGNHVLLGNYKFTFSNLQESPKWIGSFGKL